MSFIYLFFIWVLDIFNAMATVLCPYLARPLKGVVALIKWWFSIKHLLDIWNNNIFWKGLVNRQNNYSIHVWNNRTWVRTLESLLCMAASWAAILPHPRNCPWLYISPGHKLVSVKPSIGMFSGILKHTPKLFRA